jgi:hypothetical protein
MFLLPKFENALLEYNVYLPRQTPISDDDAALDTCDSEISMHWNRQEGSL